MATAARDAALLRCGRAVAVLLDSAPMDRNERDMAAAVALRDVIGASSIEVGRRPSGRPRLLPPHCELGVSMSVRGDLMLVGCDLLEPVGVDLELAGSLDGAEAVRLARDHFTPDEAAHVARAPAAEAAALFLAFWVGKEAALKRTGRGVFDGLHWPQLSIARALREGEIVEVELAAHGAATASRLVIGHLTAGDGRHVLAALCAPPASS